MNKLLATVVIAATLGMAGTSANAGIFTDMAKGVLKPARQQADDAARQRKAAAGGQYGYFADKPYMACIRYMNLMGRNEKEKAQGVNNCNKDHGYPYRR